VDIGEEGGAGEGVCCGSDGGFSPCGRTSAPFGSPRELSSALGVGLVSRSGPLVIVKRRVFSVCCWWLLVLVVIGIVSGGGDSDGGFSPCGRTSAPFGSPRELSSALGVGLVSRSGPLVIVKWCLFRVGMLLFVAVGVGGGMVSV
jgi:hypothetical protein